MTMYSSCDTPKGGFPHSEISGSKLICQLPEAYRRLPRPSSPLSSKSSPIRPLYLDHNNLQVRKPVISRKLDIPPKRLTRLCLACISSIVNLRASKLTADRRRTRHPPKPTTSGLQPKHDSCSVTPLAFVALTPASTYDSCNYFVLQHHSDSPNSSTATGGEARDHPEYDYLTLTWFCNQIRAVVPQIVSHSMLLSKS